MAFTAAGSFPWFHTAGSWSVSCVPPLSSTERWVQIVPIKIRIWLRLIFILLFYFEPLNNFLVFIFLNKFLETSLVSSALLFSMLRMPLVVQLFSERRRWIPERYRPGKLDGRVQPRGKDWVAGTSASQEALSTVLCLILPVGALPQWVRMSVGKALKRGWGNWSLVRWSHRTRAIERKILNTRSNGGLLYAFRK